MSEAEASLVAKWSARDPALGLALLFLPPRLRRGFGVWAALLRELEEAALNRRAPEAGAAKLRFYAEELGAIVGRSSHPLVAAWHEGRAAAAGARLAETLARLRDFEAAASLPALGEALAPYAAHAAESAQALVGERLPAAALRADFLARRLLELPAEAAAGRLWVPLALLAEEGLDRGALEAREAERNPAVARLRRRLARLALDEMPSAAAAGIAGALLEALARVRLRALAGGRAWAPWRALLAAWRAARRGGRRTPC